jgi:hypothetical protein
MIRLRLAFLFARLLRGTRWRQVGVDVAYRAVVGRLDRVEKRRAG